MIRAPAQYSLFGESPAPPERRRRKFRRKRSGTRTADCGKIVIFRAGSGEWWIFIQVHPPKGAALKAPDLSGHRTEGRQMHSWCVCRLFLLRTCAHGETGGPVGRQTPLFNLHQELGARIVDFGGWDMPVQYSSQIGEAPRRAPGSRCIRRISYVCGGSERRQGAAVPAQARRHDVDKLTRPGKALYTCMLNESGGVIDDLIVYFLTDSGFPVGRQRGHAGQRPSPGFAPTRASSTDAVIERSELAMLAIQGPEGAFEEQRDSSHVWAPPPLWSSILSSGARSMVGSWPERVTPARRASK